ncbi:MAG TPA: molybdopterin cofactor-binding domain-containing protein, partial [Gemmatimonadales bacterium]|nr:molybdopterin cofactor-binding domain-containing protein [Gemmatimonadales bacterium]
MSADVTRREFVKAGAALSGLVVVLQLPAYARTAVAALARVGPALSPAAFLQIAPDGTITFWVSKCEMGQGVRSALPMIVAEELDVAPETIRVEQASADPKYGDQATGGSSSISSLWQPLRKAGAQARAMLI